MLTGCWIQLLLHTTGTQQETEASQEKGTFVLFPQGKGAGLSVGFLTDYFASADKRTCVRLCSPTRRIRSGSGDHHQSHPCSDSPPLINTLLTNWNRCNASSHCIYQLLASPVQQAPVLGQQGFSTGAGSALYHLYNTSGTLVPTMLKCLGLGPKTYFGQRTALLVTLKPKE